MGYLNECIYILNIPPSLLDGVADSEISPSMVPSRRENPWFLEFLFIFEYIVRKNFYSREFWLFFFFSWAFLSKEY